MKCIIKSASSIKSKHDDQDTCRQFPHVWSLVHTRSARPLYFPFLPRVQAGIRIDKLADNHRREGIMSARKRTAMIVTTTIIFCLFTAVCSKNSQSVPLRPDLVREALEKNGDLYYFGVGSNMLRSKLENRSICGSKIELKSMEPAFVRNYRLAFNMRGFPPLEPGMGSLQPVDDKSTSTQSKPLLAFEKKECHGALVRVSAADYEKIMRSEGVGNGRPEQAYQEVVVEAVPYAGGRPVQAVALQAREHVRLRRDPAPSRRYLEILRQGANELGLDPCYKKFLDSHPAASLCPLTRRLAVCNLLWTAKIFRSKIRSLSRMQTNLLWSVYVPPTANAIFRFLSELATAAILFPGAMPGSCLLLYHKLAKKELSKMMKSLVESHW